MYTIIIVIIINIVKYGQQNKQGNHVSGNRRMSSPGKTPKTTGNNAWFKSLDRFGKRNNNNNTVNNKVVPPIYTLLAHKLVVVVVVVGLSNCFFF